MWGEKILERFKKLVYKSRVPVVEHTSGTTVNYNQSSSSTSQWNTVDGTEHPDLLEGDIVTSHMLCCFITALMVSGVYAGHCDSYGI